MDHFHRSNENTGSSNLLFAHAKIWSPAIVIAAISLRPPYAPQLWICGLQVMNPKHTNCPYKILAAIRPIDFLSILFTNWALTAACGSHQDVRRKFLGLRNETIGARPSQTFFFFFFFLDQKSFSIELIHMPRLYSAFNKRCFACRLNCNNSYWMYQVKK